MPPYMADYLAASEAIVQAFCSPGPNSCSVSGHTCSLKTSENTTYRHQDIFDTICRHEVLAGGRNGR